MKLSVRVPNFLPSTHGLPWPNWYPVGTPVFLMRTPLGALGVPDASRGLCGGMIFTTMDLHHHGIRSIPQAPEKPVFEYICHRLFTSWGLPFGWMKYWDWQNRPDRTRTGLFGRTGVLELTINSEWPKIRTALDAGQLVAVGLVNVQNWRLTKLGLNHQVLVYGYDFDEETTEVTLQTYDPNYPGDDTITMRFKLNSVLQEGPVRITHTVTGPTIRGVFLTDYRPLTEPPAFALRGPV
jgi:hypothetical protein